MWNNEAKEGPPPAQAWMDDEKVKRNDKANEGKGRGMGGLRCADGDEVRE